MQGGLQQSSSLSRRKWHYRVAAALDARCAHAPRLRTYYGDVWRDYVDADLADPELVAGLTGTSDTQFRQRLWEMLLGRHLHACGHHIKRRPVGQPDFCFEVEGSRVWVEAISPTPGPDLPVHWTTHNPADPGPAVGDVPNREMALRWTSAFKDKAVACSEYREKGIVRSNDAFVIAIDGSQLSKFPHTHGISQRPFVVEAVFAVGPVGIEVDPDTAKMGRPFQTVEGMLANRNGAPVYKERFFRSEFAGITAVLGCSPSSHAPSMLPVQVAYNPLAQAPLAPGHLGQGAEEWIAKLASENAEFRDWELQRL